MRYWKALERSLTCRRCRVAMGWDPGCSVKVEQVDEKSCSELWTHDGKARIKAAEG